MCMHPLTIDHSQHPKVCMRFPSSTIHIHTRHALLSRKRKFTDKELPERADVLLPQSRMLSQLLALEQRLDTSISDKLINVRAALKNRGPTPVRGMMSRALLLSFSLFHTLS